MPARACTGRRRARGHRRAVDRVSAVPCLRSRPAESSRPADLSSPPTRPTRSRAAPRGGDSLVPLAHAPFVWRVAPPWSHSPPRLAPAGADSPARHYRVRRHFLCGPFLHRAPIPPLCQAKLRSKQSKQSVITLKPLWGSPGTELSTCSEFRVYSSKTTANRLS